MKGMGRGEMERGWKWRRTSARCCCPLPYVLSFNAVAPLRPEVAKSGVLRSTEALVDG